MYFKVALFVLFFSEISGKISIFPQIPNLVQHGETELCKIESNIYEKNLRNYTIWAHKMLDSSVKGTFGILRGNNYQFGNYDECLNINGPFPSQYCLLDLIVNVPPRNSTDIDYNPYGTVLTKFENFRISHSKLGMCFPSSCSASEIQASLTETFNAVQKPFNTVGITYNVTSTKEFCSDYIYPKKFGKPEIVLCIITAILLMLVLIGTIFDCIKNRKENPNTFGISKKLCLSFSAQTSLNELFKTTNYQDETKIFDGVKSISLVVVYTGHFMISVMFLPWLNGSKLDEMSSSTSSNEFQQFDMVVDIFFVISGLLLVHGILKKWKEVKVNAIWLIFYRYMRLTPLNLYVSLYYITMFAYFGSGPLWNLTYILLIKDCKEYNNWWLNVLYINNFMTDSTEACNIVTWYIACDFQLFIMGVLVMFVMQRNLRVGYVILAFLFILSIIATFTTTKIYEILPLVIYGSAEYKNFFNNYYIKPYTRAPSYIIGMYGGFIYDKLKSKEVKISKLTSYVVTGLSLLAMVVSSIYFIFPYNGQETFQFEYALYNALHRPIWSIGILGIFIVASFGSLPAIRLFLSSSIWTPFAKLSYGFYLINFMVNVTSFMAFVTAVRLRFLNTASLFIALFILSYVLALFLYVFVEAPFVRILKFTLLRKFYENKAIKKSEEKETIEENTKIN